MTSPTALTAINSPKSSEVFCALLTISDPSALNPFLPICVASDNADTFVVGDRNVRGIIYAGVNYLWFPFEMTLPTISDDTSLIAHLVISGVDRRVIRAIKAIPVAPQVDITVIMTSQRAVSGYVPEGNLVGFRMREIKTTPTSVSGSLTFENLRNEPYPWRAMNPTEFPGMHSS